MSENFVIKYDLVPRKIAFVEWVVHDWEDKIVCTVKAPADYITGTEKVEKAPQMQATELAHKLDQLAFNLLYLRLRMIDSKVYETLPLDCRVALGDAAMEMQKRADEVRALQRFAEGKGDGVGPKS